MTEVTLQAKPVRIKAVKWDGSDASREELKAFVPRTDLRFNDYPDADYPLDVWNYLEEQWIHVPFGHWVIRGLRDEYYPCEETALFMKYDVVNE